MPTSWQTIRVFISSTFRDMQAERDHLVRFVFPRLREQLLPHRIHLVDVDLRWGVSSDQEASEVCREIINECRPRFLCMLGGRYGWVPAGKTRSITADEVHYGVLDRALKDRGFAYFYFRDDAATAAMVETTPGELREPQGSDNQNKLAELKQAIVTAGLKPFTYPAQWDHESSRLVGLKKFGDRVHDDLLGSISSDPQLRDRFVTDTTAQLEEFAEENAAMEAFIEERSERFVLGSRETVLNELLTHASATGGNGYVCLTGAPGSGKSALLSHLYRTLGAPLSSSPSAIRSPESEIVIIPHFVGASPGSTDVRRTLLRLCHELKASCPNITADIPDDSEKLRVAFPEFLRQSCAKKRVLILIDAVNQFDPASHFSGLYWLPEKLPDTARVILSALDGPVLEDLRRRCRQPYETELKPLTTDDGEAIIEEFRKRYHKKFEPEQRAALLVKTDAGTPLYLLAALEELRTLGAYERITGRIAELPPTTHGLFVWILARLENDDDFRDASGRRMGHELVSLFAALLCASRYGLSQRELADLVAPGNDKADPPIEPDTQGNVAALLHLLRPYLMRRGELLDFYHRQFRAAAEGAWLKTERQRWVAHAQLADYFDAQNYFLESLEDQRQRAKTLPPTPRPADVRKVDELPWQLLAMGEQTKSSADYTDNGENKPSESSAAAHLVPIYDRIEQSFTTLDFLEAKIEAGMVFELVGDFASALQTLPTERPKHFILSLLHEALRRDVHFIARHPTTLFQCMWNSCWWYDCSEAVGHYDPPDGGWPSEGPPWERSRAKLSSLLESWRTSKEKGTPNFVWMRSLRPPVVHLGTGQRAMLLGHRDMVTGVTYSPDGQRIASAGARDQTVRLWDPDSGRELRCFRSLVGPVSGVDFSPDSRRIACGTWRGSIQVWDTANGEPLVCRSAHSNAEICSVVYSPDSARIASAGSDGTVRVWHADSGEQLGCLQGHEGRVSCAAYSPDGQRMVSGGSDKTVRLWVVSNGEPLACLHGHEEEVLSVAWSPDSRWIVSGAADETIRVWDADSGVLVACFRGHVDEVNSVAFSPDSQRVVSVGGYHDRTVRVWNVKTGQELARFHGHEAQVCCVAYSPDGKRIVSGGYDRTVRVWDADAGEPMACLREHIGQVRCIRFSPDGCRIISGGDNTVRVWSGEYGVPLACLRGHNAVVYSVAYSLDGRRIVSGAADKTVRVWDAASGQQLACLQGHERIVESVAYSPNGGRIVSGSGDGTVRVWDAASGQQLFCLQGHEGEVWCVAYSPDSLRIVSGGSDKTVRVWNADTGELLASMDGHQNWVWSVAYSSDGLQIISGKWDKIIQVGNVDYDDACRVWDSYNGACIKVLWEKGDVAAIAAGAPQFPWRALLQGSETVIESAVTGKEVAWFPITSDILLTDPKGRTWASADGNHLHIITLEGVHENAPR